MASPTTILPILLLLTFSTLSLTSPNQPNTQEQDIASLAAWASTESSIPTSTLLSSLSSYSNNLASAPLPALITGLSGGGVTAASSLLVEEAGLVKNDLKPTLKGYQGSTITVAQSTRTIMTTRISNGTGASNGMPGNKSANGTGMMMSISSAVRPVGNATVLPPEPIFTTAGPKSEAGREVGRGMGMGMGVLVVVGLGVWGVMVVL